MSAAPTPTTDDRLAELCRFNDDGKRKSYLQQYPELVTAQAVEQLAETARSQLRIDLDQALRTAESATVIAESLGQPYCLARALRAKANAFWFKGQCRPAVDLLDRALTLFEEAGNTDEAGKTLSTSIQPLILLGEYEHAQRNAARAREIFSRQGDQLRLARLDINVANIHHRQEHFDEALASYERAYSQLVPYGDTEGIGVALHNMAVCLISLDDFERARATYDQARAFFQQHSMPLLVSQADYNLAYLHHLRGDYERALEILRSTRESCLMNGDAYHAALCDLDQSEIYVELNLAGQASQIAQRSIEQFERLGMGYETARSLTNLAIATSQLRNQGGAMEAFARAKAVFVKEGHLAGQSLVDLYQAILLFEAADTGAAKRLCLNASQFFGSSGMPRRAVVCELLLGRIALSESRLDDALECCQRAFRQLETLQAPVLSYQAYFLSGEIYETSGDARLSFEAYQSAAKALETVRSSLQGEELKIAFMANRLEVYERLAMLSLRRGTSGGPAEEALSYVERAKCRSLVESIYGRAKPLPTRSMPGRSDEQVSNLRARLNWIYHRIESEQINQSGVAPETIERLWRQARAGENLLLEAIRESTEFGQPSQVAEGQAIASLSEIQAALGTNTTLVEYFQTGEEVLAAIVSPGSIDVLPLARMPDVRNRLRMLHFQLSKFQLGPSYTEKLERPLKAAVLRHAQDLYKDLVAPLHPLLKGDHLVLVPHGFLHYLPFQALHDGDRFLIDQYTISYAPSASMYAMSQRSSTGSNGCSLILGVEDPNAPWISEEVREVAAVLPNSSLLLGEQASVGALQSWDSEYRLVHIATHGIFRGDNPMFSAVRLSDAYLSLYDIYNLRLPSELLTLSGCGTGLNVVAAGDELIGLTRGLLYAGAQTLLLTLWDVHDRTTAEFMKSFYLRLGTGCTKAAAMQGAMVEIRERHPHPYYWAPFILVGKAP